MKKLILLFLLIGTFSAGLKAQSFEISEYDTLVADPEVSFEVYSKAKVKNLTGQPIRTIVSREAIQLAPNHINYFCWGVNCYGPLTITSPDTLLVEAQGVNTTFKGYIDPSGNDGASVIRYCFINATNPSDRTCFVARYLLGTAAVSNPGEPGQATKVPASYDAYSQTIKVNVNGGKIEILNMLGQKADLTFRYDGTGMIADASSLKTGYYFLFGNNEKGPWSARVIVTK
jgi:hypothetical protein